MNRIVINADDLGLSTSSTAAIIKLLVEGKISSATIMANGTDFDGAVKAIKANNLERRIGIHLNLTEGIPLTENIKRDTMICANGKFRNEMGLNRILSRIQKKSIYMELMEQIRKVRAHGITITHADSHHHIHTNTFLTPTILRLMINQRIKHMRISRNIGYIKLSSRIVKYVYNALVHLIGLSSIEYFGSYSDYMVRKISSNRIEIMIHPDYNKIGDMIDRVGYIDGAPFGNNICEVLNEQNEYTILEAYEY